MDRLSLSLEVFPPKVDVEIQSLYPTIGALKALQPEFISVTYSAGGSAKGLTSEVCSCIKRDYGIESVAHLTCAGSNCSEIKAFLSDLRSKGIDKVLALRGDLSAEKQLTEYIYATDLIAEINSFGGFEVYAACYPEGHTQSTGFERDIEVMKIKDGLGVKKFLSQLFFDNADFMKMTEMARNAGVTAEICAGIMPVTSAKQIVRMVQLSGAKIPPRVAKILSKYEHKPEQLFLAGIDYSIEQIRALYADGVTAVHLYTMNNPRIASAVYQGIKDLL